MKNVLIIIGLLFCSSYSFSQTFEGSWLGSLNIQGTEMPLIFNITNNGKWEGTLKSPKQSNESIALSNISIAKDSIYIELKMIGLKYQGKLSADKQSIDGDFSQGSLKSKMLMKKQEGHASANSFTYKRSQEVNPPYAYDTLDVAFVNDIDKISLAGTITSPKAKGKYPAVILVSGSGPQDRNESLMGHKPFKVLADYLTKNGIVVLRYDDRGVAKSEGEYQKATTGDFGKDVLAGIKFLQKQENVDPKKIGLIGHSEGGLIAFILAGQKVPGLNFIVSLAGPAIPMDSLLLLQNEAIMKTSGKIITEQEKVLIRENYRIVKSDLPADKAFDAIRANMKNIPGSQSLGSAEELSALLTPWFRHFLKIDPIPFIEKIKIPVFAAFGGKDVQVLAMQNMEGLTDHLPKNKSNFINVYPSLNHLFQQANTGAVGEYIEIEETINPAVLKDIADWIKKTK